MHTRTCIDTRQGRTLDYSPLECMDLMLASSVQAVVVCNATAPRVCILVLFIPSEASYTCADHLWQ